MKRQHILFLKFSVLWFGHSLLANLLDVFIHRGYNDSLMGGHKSKAELRPASWANLASLPHIL